MLSTNSSPSSRGSEDYAYDSEPESVSILQIRINRGTDNGFEIFKLVDAEADTVADHLTSISRKLSSESSASSDAQITYVQEYFKMVDLLRQFFCNKSTDEDSKKKLNYPQIQYCITFLEQLKEHFKTSWPYEMDGSCIRIAVNHQSNACVIKLVDKSNIRQVSNVKTNVDFVEGLQSFIGVLKLFMFSYEYEKKQVLEQIEIANRKISKLSVKCQDMTPKPMKSMRGYLLEQGVESVLKMDTEAIELRQASPRNVDDMTGIDLEQASCCFSEDEDMVEWETLISNGLDSRNNGDTDSLYFKAYSLHHCRAQPNLFKRQSIQEKMNSNSKDFENVYGFKNRLNMVVNS